MSFATFCNCSETKKSSFFRLGQKHFRWDGKKNEITWFKITKEQWFSTFFLFSGHLKSLDGPKFQKLFNGLKFLYYLWTHDRLYVVTFLTLTQIARNHSWEPVQCTEEESQKRNYSKKILILKEIRKKKKKGSSEKSFVIKESSSNSFW